MSVEIRIQGVKRFTAKMKSLSVYARNQFAPEVVQHGFKYAKKIAPHDTGALMRAIKKKKGKKSAKLVLIQPNDGGRRRPYHLWMHGIRAPGPASGGGANSGYDISRGKYMPKSGKRGPKFMFAARDEMIKDSTERFKKKVDAL